MGTRLRQVHDPHYMQNVAEDPEYEVVRARMEERLLAILTEQNDFESQERLEDVVEELTELQRALEQVLGQAGELMEDVLSDAELSTEDASPRGRSGRYTYSKPVAKDRLQTREEAWARCGHTSLFCTLHN